MASGAAHLLSMGLGLFFCTTGLPKLFSFIPAHKLLKDEFVNFAAVFPLKPLGIVPNPTLYLYAIGVIELGCGVMLGLGSHEQQVASMWPQLSQFFRMIDSIIYLKIMLISAMVLLGVMVGAIHTLVSLGRRKAECIPAAVCLSLLGLFLTL
ncbi:transmembrane protein 35B-like [Branchiostoma floridae]|uniref:Transmembrane protein 35B-like n=1 Tax=Branchiostoma floridae TaxID=7739 RepID=A0A9J7LWW9_BRAFL|nr:transmembrane protein 35B-like [Branchiostoma floridae]